jgi:ATP adenylyltransferase
MDRLWAPWRAQYIRASTDSAPSPESSPSELACFLCLGLASDRERDRDHLVAWRRPHSVVVLNRYPYNNGHLLVAPNVHEGRLGGLSGLDLTEPLETVKLALDVLDRIFRPQGYNIGLNQGSAAGAGLPGHLHWHIVPRWDGDTNFMPVLGRTKVIVESLLEFYDTFVAELGHPDLDLAAAP